MVTKGDSWVGGDKLRVGSNIHALLHIKQINIKEDTGNYTQYAITYNG